MKLTRAIHVKTSVVEVASELDQTLEAEVITEATLEAVVTVMPEVEATIVQTTAVEVEDKVTGAVKLEKATREETSRISLTKMILIAHTVIPRKVRGRSAG